MRIIAGEARGRTILAPPGSGTRPTQDYVRESLFNILMPRIPGARVLDLFAGTGALALEAVSRGAAFAQLCDRDRAALSCLRRNVASVGAEDRCRVFAGDWQACLRSLSGQPPFDLVFLDPPYRMDNTGEIAGLLMDAALLAPGFLIAAEHRRGAPPRADARFSALRTRRYGDTEITFLAASEEG